MKKNSFFVFMVIAVLFLFFLPAGLCQNKTLSLSRSENPASNFAPITEDKNIYVDRFTGSVNQVIPITFPPSRKSLPASLNLLYSSSASNGWLGVGWRLDLSYIERSTKNGYPKYDSSDTFLYCLSGMQGELVNSSGQEYRPKVADKAIKFVYDGLRWTVKDAMGVTYYFGLDNNLSDYSRTCNPKNSAQVYRWRLSKVMDTLGNSLIFKYLADKIEIYYSEINEASKGAFKEDAYNYLVTISFANDRTDRITNCRSGFNDNYPLNGSGRINEVVITFNGQSVRKYVLGYEYSNITGRSLLKKITEYGSDNQTHNPPIKLSYAKQGPAYASLYQNKNKAGDNQWNIYFCDTTVDPKIQSLKNSIDFLGLKGFVTQGFDLEGFVLWGRDLIPVNWTILPTESQGENSGFSWVRQANGDITIKGKKGHAFYISTYVTVDTEKGLDLPFESDGCKVHINNAWSVAPGYFNYVTITGYNLDRDYSFTLKNNIVNQVQWMNSQQPTIVIPQLSGDFNGDGITDTGVFAKEEGKVEILLTGKNGVLSDKNEWITSFGKNANLILGDFNGDGKTDICSFDSSAGTWRVAFSDGTKFVDQGVWLSGFGKDAPYAAGDFNGNGIMDIGIYSLSGSNLCFRAAFSDGKSFVKQDEFSLEDYKDVYGTIRTGYTGDFNGDEITDFMLLHPGNTTEDTVKIYGYNNSWSVGPVENRVVMSSLGGVSYNGVVTEYPGFSDCNYDAKADIYKHYRATPSNECITMVSNLDNINIPSQEKILYKLQSQALMNNRGQIQSGDFNGDGIMDFVAYNDTSDVEMVLSTKCVPSDLLIVIENGWGGQMNFDYKPSTSYDNGSSDNSSGLPFSMPVIAKVSILDGTGNVYETNYSYSKGYYDLKSKEFRGFQKTLSNNNEGIVIGMEFLQDDIYKGKVLNQKVFDAQGKLLSETINAWTNNSPYSGTYLVSLSGTQQYTYNADSSYKQKNTTFQYDAYGNQTKTKEEGDVDNSQDDREIITDYVYNTKDWLLSYPSRVVVNDAQGRKVQEKLLYYDNSGRKRSNVLTNGLLTGEDVWLYNPSQGGTSSTVSYSYEYDSFGNLTKVIDHLGRSSLTEYDYQVHSYPVKTTNSLGQVIQQTYDFTTGQLLTITDANNQTTQNIYDNLGRLIKVVGPLDSEANPAINHTYNSPLYEDNILANGSFDFWELKLDDFRAAFWFPIDWCVNSIRLWVKVGQGKDADNKADSYALRLDGNETLIVGGASKCYYDYPDYNSFTARKVIFTCLVKASNSGRVRIAVEDGVGRTESVFHSGSGNWELLTVVHQVASQPQKLSFSLEITGSYSALFDNARAYDADNPQGPITITKKTKSVYAAESSPYLINYSFYDGLGRIIQTKSPADNDPQNGSSRQIVSGVVKYNSKGQIKENYFPYFASDTAEKFDKSDLSGKPKTNCSYDALSRLIKTTNADNSTKTNDYSGWTAVTTDENGHKTVNTYDAYGKIIKVEEYNSSQVYTTKYQYDALGNLIKITDNNGNVSTFAYDSLGHKVKAVDPDMGVWTYEYDLVGNIKKQTDAKGRAITFNYDGLNRLISKLANQQTLVSYSYDDTSKPNCIGRLSKVTDQSGSTEFFYDKLGREVKTVKTIGASAYTFEKTYNPQNIQLNKYPNGEVVNYGYNSANQIKSLTGDVSYVKNIGYTASGQIAKIELSNGAVTNYTYDPNNLRIVNIATQSQSNPVQDLTYTFDKVGNVSAIQDKVNTASQTFIYDDLNRLVQASGSYGAQTYSYDPIGNIQNKEGVGYSYGRLHPHAVTALSDGTTFTYDLNGNLISKSKDGNNQVFTYDVENHVTEVDDSVILPPKNELTIQLKPELNYISFPYGSKNLREVLGSIGGVRQEIALWNTKQGVYLYNVADKDFDQFDTVDSGKGYWIYINNTNGATLKLEGNIPDAYSVYLEAGWNAIGCPYDKEVPVEEALNNLKFGTDYISVYRYAFKDKPWYQEYSVNKKEFTTMKPGEGYWVKVPKAVTWNIDNRARKRAAANNKTQFVYDYNGTRVKKIVNSTDTTIYAGDSYEVCPDGNTKSHIFLGTTRICSITKTPTKGRTPAQSSISYYHSDHLGSSNVMTNDKGEKIQLTEYAPFGSILKGLSPQGTVPVSNYLFTGKELDISTNLYYYGARYYDSKLGRFLCPDKVASNFYDPQLLNHYSYARDNPVFYIDPSGAIVTPFLAAGVCGVTTGIASAAAYHFSTPASDRTLAGYAQSFGVGFGMGLIGGAAGGFFSTAFEGVFSPITSGILEGAVSGWASEAWRDSLPNTTPNYGPAIIIGGITGGLATGFIPQVGRPASWDLWPRDNFYVGSNSWRIYGQEALSSGLSTGFSESYSSFNQNYSFNNFSQPYDSFHDSGNHLAGSLSYSSYNFNDHLSSYSSFNYSLSYSNYSNTNYSFSNSYSQPFTSYSGSGYGYSSYNYSSGSSYSYSHSSYNYTYSSGYSSYGGYNNSW